MAAIASTIGRWTAGAAEELGRLAGSRAFLWTLVAILPCAGVLVGLDLAHRYARIDGTALPFQFSLSEDGSLGEWFEYALTLATAAAMLSAWARRRAGALAYVAIGLLFLWLTLDNEFMLHEAAGEALAPLFAGLASADSGGEHLGEFAFLLGFGLAATAGVLIAVRASERLPALHALLLLAGLVGAAGFGIAVDLFNSLSPQAGLAGRLIFDFIEDAGELAMLLLVAALAIAIRARASSEAMTGAPAADQPGSAVTPA